MEVKQISSVSLGIISPNIEKDLRFRPYITKTQLPKGGVIVRAEVEDCFDDPPRAGVTILRRFSDQQVAGLLITEFSRFESWTGDQDHQSLVLVRPDWPCNEYVIKDSPVNLLRCQKDRRVVVGVRIKNFTHWDIDPELLDNK